MNKKEKAESETPSPLQTTPKKKKKKHTPKAYAKRLWKWGIEHIRTDESDSKKKKKESATLIGGSTRHHKKNKSQKKMASQVFDTYGVTLPRASNTRLTQNYDYGWNEAHTYFRDKSVSFGRTFSPLTSTDMAFEKSSKLIALASNRANQSCRIHDLPPIFDCGIASPQMKRNSSFISLTTHFPSFLDDEDLPQDLTTQNKTDLTAFVTCHEDFGNRSVESKHLPGIPLLSTSVVQLNKLRDLSSSLESLKF